MLDWLPHPIPHAALPHSFLVLETASQPMVGGETTGPPLVNSVVTEQQRVPGPRGEGGDHEARSSWSFCFTPIFVYVGRGIFLLQMCSRLQNVHTCLR